MGRGNQVAVVADDNALCAAGLLHIAEQCLDFSRVIACRNFRELAGILGQYRSRVGLAVVQFDLPGMKRANGLRRLCEDWPSVPILVTGDSYEADTVLEALSAGSHGFILKNSSPTELKRALRAAAAGQIVVSALSMGGSAHEPAKARRFHEADLTARQREVLNLLAAGNSNKQIARALGISEGTVKVHVNAAFRVLGVHNRVNATTVLLGLSDLAHNGA